MVFSGASTDREGAAEGPTDHHRADQQAGGAVARQPERHPAGLGEARSGRGGAAHSAALRGRLPLPEHPRPSRQAGSRGENCIRILLAQYQLKLTDRFN